MPTISPVVIANMALANISDKSSIESLDERGTQAAQCKLWYDFSLRQCLEAYDWSFARKRAALAAAGDDPPDQWSFRYQIPADCVAPRRIWNPGGDDCDAVPFEIETDSTDTATILTDMETAQLVYTKYITNAAVFKPVFVELLARCLASHIAFPLTGKREIAKDQADTYRTLLRSAPSYDANEQVKKPPRDADWIRGRNFNGFFDRRFR